MSSRANHHYIDTTLDKGVDIKNRIIFIDRTIDYDEAEEMIRAISVLTQLSDDPITLVINSPGGDVYSGFAIYDMLVESGCKIITKGYGLIASMASILFLAGDVRIMGPHSRYMVHSIQAWIDGSTRDIKIEAKEIEKLEDMMANIYSARTKKKDKKFWKKFERNTYFSAEMCKQLGITHKISGE